ncbi:RIP metalloprotease RseP [Chlorobium sp. N1]|uniref:RIP metalloprotease RseP n=1 Tax=Chlorobium sp. N1 TaxID=2491138 RepID=UPI00103C37AC|nr:RIP metalloprotease RseP [Chlorobium sp. N1]TCD48264.1 RIP metalloprotease RseP [Chlorobium sp. N1]
MDILSTTFFFIIAIFILVTVHEFGHFITARIFGMRVDKFYIGFDFFDMRLWKKKIGETEYGIGVFPLGGYVKIAGMVDESMDTDFGSSEPQPWEFRAKPVWQRLVVLAGGVAMNMVLAAMIFTGVTLVLGEARTSTSIPAYVDEGSVFEAMGMQTGDRFVAVDGAAVSSWEEALDPERFTSSSPVFTVRRADGRDTTLPAPKQFISEVSERNGFGIRPIVPPLIDEVLAKNPAEAAGIRAGSLITAIDGRPVSDWTEVVEIISSHPSEAITITWRRLEAAEGEVATAENILLKGTDTTATVTPAANGKIGIMLRQNISTERRMLGFGGSLKSGIEQTWKMSAMTVQGFTKIFTGQEDFRKSVGGPIKIAKIANRSAEQGPVSFLYFLAVLSISLAVINILPVPALDGGQFVLNAAEGVMRREIPIEVKMRIQQIGMTLLLALFAYILLNDILNP